MKNCLFFLLVALMLIVSCNFKKSAQDKKNPVFVDTLLYHYTTFKQRAPDCGTKPDSGCTVVQFKYPVLTNQQPLNDTVRHRAASLFTIYKKPDTSFKAFADRFISTYRQEMVNRSGATPYTLNIAANVLRQDSSLVTLQIGGYDFQGGAHGSSLTTFINWDVQSQRIITLKDILIENYQHPLDSVGEKIFRTQEKLSDTEPLKNNYFFVKDKFSLNNNFAITPTGLRFIYNEYEIKPYAAGKTELVIPYAQIKALLRPNTVISQYHY